MIDPKLTSLKIGDGEIVSVEALHEGIDLFNDFRNTMLAQHQFGKAGLVHPSPLFAEAVAYLTVDIPGHLADSSPKLTTHWAEGFTSDPKFRSHPYGFWAIIEWEVERKGPQLINVGFEWATKQYPYDFYWDIRWQASGIDGKGQLSISTENHAQEGPGNDRRATAQDIRGILIVVRTF